MTMEEIAFEAEIIARLKELQQSNDIQLAHYQLILLYVTY